MVVGGIDAPVHINRMYASDVNSLNSLIQFHFAHAVLAVYFPTNGPFRHNSFDKSAREKKLLRASLLRVILFYRNAKKAKFFSGHAAYRSKHGLRN